MLFNEPKLLKSTPRAGCQAGNSRFSALQRAEIAEIAKRLRQPHRDLAGFSALQRAEIAEIVQVWRCRTIRGRFSALQRAEIAEIATIGRRACTDRTVSVLFNEPKLLKLRRSTSCSGSRSVSVLFNEPKLLKSLQALVAQILALVFQCSSTSRNC